MKKFILLFTIVAALIVFVEWQQRSHANLDVPESACTLCKSETLTRQLALETDFCRVLINYKPITEGHSMIMPRRHVGRLEDLNDRELAELMLMVKRVHMASREAFAAEDYLLLQKNGASVGQSQGHVHIHYIPRKAGEKSHLWFTTKFFAPFFTSPLSEEDQWEARDRLREALRQT